jgi:transcription-repair coupling factor (superfamily II helicase)
MLQLTGRPLLVILPGREEAELTADELDALVEDSGAVFLPDPSGGSPVATGPVSAGIEMQVLRDLALSHIRAVVTYGEAALRRYPDPAWMRRSMILLAEGGRHDLQELIERLIGFGYSREILVEKPGEISVRGGILDIFPLTGEAPHRIEFWGDRIETLRTFDLSTQRSIGRAELLTLVPLPSASDHASAKLMDYFESPPIIFLEDPDLVWGEHRKPSQTDQHFSPDELRSALSDLQTVTHFTLAAPAEAFNVGAKPVSAGGRTVVEIRNFFRGYSGETLVFCESADQSDRLFRFLELDADPLPNVSIESGPLRRGFRLDEIGLSVIAEAELFGRVVQRLRHRRFREGVPIRELSALAKGDYVVHIDHGIGVYQGLERIAVAGSGRECLLLLYEGGDKLYVPVDRMERVQKYTGRDGAVPALSKLGGTAWEKTKSKTKQAIQAVAKDLIALYSARQTKPGIAFSPDTPWQKELEASFDFDETPDQLQAVQDVKQDMERPRPMDRLILGDVGFGKTEVAVRAAFKAVQDGKQVAILVPTTILAQQHGTTFQERLGRFPVRIEILSRFKNPKEQADILSRVKTGEVDILIGTHRLLSKDVGFKDLGLLVIDEEQRFGVRHKERLKAMRETVDALAMTATPIPRTLYLSLMSIRDLSVIHTPPRDRLPIITEVAPFGEDVIADAIQRELARGGQVFFVHNRVRSIESVADLLRRLVPGIRLGVAHGQMQAHELERVMLDFLEGRFDCLVSTMIIEAGLDMPHVNTLIIHRADRFGLSQLYQLRGRVGRSDKRAYAYLLTPPFKRLTPDALKRLRTIEEFTELGSGYQIALRDLEIRGAGNLLGVRQSGHLDAVGFDLYQRLIREAVEELKSDRPAEPEIECRVDLPVDALLPDDYVSDESLRVNLYRRLSGLVDSEAIADFGRELADRFGRPPAEAVNLMDIAELRVLGKKAGVQSIHMDDRTIRIHFDPVWLERFPDQAALSQWINGILKTMTVPVRFSQSKGFGLSIPIPENAVAWTKKLLQSWG